MELKPGQPVIVLHGHINGANLEGRIVRLYGGYEFDDRRQTGKYLVDIEGLHILIETERLVPDA